MKMDYNEGGTYVVLGRNVILSSDKQVDNENCHECTNNVLFHECKAREIMEIVLRNIY